VVRFPEFQSIKLLPTELQTQLRDELEKWYNENNDWLLNDEKQGVQKIISYLTDSPEFLYNLDKDKLQVDFKKFLLYYNKTSKHQYQDIYPESFLRWIDSIET